jgi:hypothetical protein
MRDLSPELRTPYFPAAYPFSFPSHNNLLFIFFFHIQILLLLLVFNLFHNYSRYLNSIESNVSKVADQLKPLPFLELREKLKLLLLVVGNIILMNVDVWVKFGWRLFVVEACCWEIFVTHINEILCRFYWWLQGLRIYLEGY